MGFLQNYIDESILSTTGVGREAQMKKYLDELCTGANRYLIKDNVILNNDGSFEFQDRETVTIKKDFEIKYWIKSVGTLYIYANDFEEFTLPTHSIFVQLYDCEKLKKLIIKKGTKINKLLLENCGNFEIECEDPNDCEFNEVIIRVSTVKSLKPLQNIKEKFSIEECVINNAEFQLNTKPIITIENGTFDKMSGVISSSYLTIENVNIKNLDLKYDMIDYLLIKKLGKTKYITISKNKQTSTLHNLTIENCKKLETITCDKIQQQISFSDLPNISRFDLDTHKKNIIFYHNCAVAPSGNCRIIEN